MSRTHVSYDQIDACVQRGRNLHARAIRDFFRSLFASEKPKAAEKGSAQPQMS